MIVADIYSRVSTDEQAEKGYSQRDQEERLRKYCEQNNYFVRKVIHEDHSAKTFNRPEWKKLLTEYKKGGRSLPSLILFTKWDRFSRNTTDAYNMIAQLNEYGIEPRAIEQPLDHSVPESKVILAIYLAAPEVENDRRALNVINGMRRARKEGRYMGIAPYGYRNRIDDNRGKYIGIDAQEATIVRWIFEELGKDRYNTEQIFRMAQKRGFPRSKAQYWRLIQNPVYMGKIEIHAFKNERAMLVKGLHIPIISENLFNEVQEVISGRRKTRRVEKAKVVSPSMLPLRGFLICPSCGKLLTGSASLGRNKAYSYHYYHCRDNCKVRYNAFDLNASFEEHLQGTTLKHWALSLFKRIILQVYRSVTKDNRELHGQMVIELKTLNEKLYKARDLLIAEEIDAKDYKELKADIEQKIAFIEEQQSSRRHPLYDFENFKNHELQKLGPIYHIYKQGSVEHKRKIIGWIYPENFVFNGGIDPQAKISDVFKTLYTFQQP